ncbi:MAG: hypothetical protein AAGD01_13455 [Acidobacteriota bacterium]
MITGYNTDVRHNDTVYHVQTEDKGTSNPYIETLVYVGGRVLAAKRHNYAQLLADGGLEKDIVALMEGQHRRTLMAIRSGKLEQKLGLGSDSQSAATVPPQGLGEPGGMGASTEVRLTDGRQVSLSGSSEVMPPQDLPASGGDRTLDQVILDYLASEADQEQLLLMMEGEESLVPGRQGGLSIRTSSSKSGQAVAGVQVAVRMISTSQEPALLGRGATDTAGELRLSLDIPVLQEGTAALIVTADSEIGTAEIKHLL